MALALIDLYFALGLLLTDTFINAVDRDIFFNVVRDLQCHQQLRMARMARINRVASNSAIFERYLR
ncbi:hypothetical protein DSUL_20092 [Desulfovibrionales bacterium]